MTLDPQKIPADEFERVAALEACPDWMSRMNSLREIADVEFFAENTAVRLCGLNKRGAICTLSVSRREVVVRVPEQDDIKIPLRCPLSGMSEVMDIIHAVLSHEDSVFRGFCKRGSGEVKPYRGQAQDSLKGGRTLSRQMSYVRAALIP